jgi:hypothetical protein
MKFLHVLLALGSGLTVAQQIDEARFDQVLAKLEGDVVEFARQVESYYANRCEEIELAQCSRGNYDECSSIYPNQECVGGDSYHIPECGDASPVGGCSGLYDFSASTVSLPAELANGANGNPTDPQVIETVCYSSAMEDWLQDKRAGDSSFWNELGVAPSAWYFGSNTGAFRIWPARQSKTCGNYDPRVRPWYVAASSGPKNVIMVLDTSASMQGVRLDLMKEAAKRVVSTLTVGDRVGIVPFNTGASAIVSNDGSMFIATEENKETLLRAIDGLEADGRTNFYDALKISFDVLDRSAQEERTVNCNTAILFLTDGEMTEPPQITEQEVLDLVSFRITQTNLLLPKPILMFTYSVSEQNAVHELPFKIACSTEFGVWSKVTTNGRIVDSLSSYYLLFALGLGSNQNEDFVAWVEPYLFTTGNTLGTSVSVPVYDRSKSPPLFLGVVAVDLALAALDTALGVTAGSEGSQQSIERVARAAIAVCPVLDLATCELESFRRQGAAGDEALCTSNCSGADFVQVEAQQCPAVSDYPSELFMNRGLLGRSYEERVCCKVGETTPSDECPEGSGGGGSIGLIIGIVAGVVVLLGLAGVYICTRGRGEGGQSSLAKQAEASSAKPNPYLAGAEPEVELVGVVVAPSAPTLAELEPVRPPPTAPHVAEQP